MTYIECWIAAAATLFSQALSGEPELAPAPPSTPAGDAPAWAATLSGEEEGVLTVFLDPAVLDAPRMGEGVDQREAWGELLREIAEAAAGDLLARAGRKCRVEKFEAVPAGSEAAPESLSAASAFDLKFADRSFTVLVRDGLQARAAAETAPAAARSDQDIRRAAVDGPPAIDAALSGIELLLDVELEATLRFGCRELPLGEILELGPGDVVPLDRRITDPADLIVGDKIVARGEVVLVNGNFGLRITEVAAPRKRLESIRCLF